MTIGDKLSVYSDKAYRKNNGRFFEAVGNVVIIGETDTVYGEVASLNQDTMIVKVEGNVRFITKDMTLYGSHIEYNIVTGSAVVKNARILTSDFNLVANQLVRVNQSEYIAHEGEFTTCKDCAESWSIYGKVIRLKVGKYVQIKHGLAKIKGVNVIYLPYIVLPILSKRETGLLVPQIGNRAGEGFSLGLPVFVALDEAKDMTITPTFWAKRGTGGDLQYRQKFSDMSWVEFNSRGLSDTIYEPGKSNVGTSGTEFFRYFAEVESHQFWSPNLNSHVRYTDARDLDIVRDHPQFIDDKILSSDIGLTAAGAWRQDLFSVGTEVNYLKNQLVSDPLEFDPSYVQTLPRVTLSTVPISVVQTKYPGLQHIALGMDGSFTRFRQVKEDESVFLRNADRISVQPYLMWHYFTAGPISLKSRYVLDQQTYRFANSQEAYAGKNAGLVQTEASFRMDKVFGLAYEESIPLKYISSKELKKIRESESTGLKPIREEEKQQRLVGELPNFESEVARDHIVQVRNSYRHSQEYNFVHHYITSQNNYGNSRFLDQVDGSSNGQIGWFDYEDSVRSEEYLYGPTTSRTDMPPENTVEFQWNNTLIKKSPKIFSFLDDEKYLRDNFSYGQIGYFNVSQGYLIGDKNLPESGERLTRLRLTTGYSASRWSVAFSDVYFHQNSDNIFSVSGTRRFNSLNIFANYNQNNISTNRLSTVSFGGQVRPTDTLGFAMVKDVDLEANRDIRTIYSFDVMPNNNCWIFNLNLSQTLVGNRYSFNIIYNFGDDNFDRYRTDYFAMKRL